MLEGETDCLICGVGGNNIKSWDLRVRNISRESFEPVFPPDDDSVVNLHSKFSTPTSKPISSTACIADNGLNTDIPFDSNKSIHNLSETKDPVANIHFDDDCLQTEQPTLNNILLE